MPCDCSTECVCKENCLCSIACECVRCRSTSNNPSSRGDVSSSEETKETKMASQPAECDVDDEDTTSKTSESESSTVSESFTESTFEEKISSPRSNMHQTDTITEKLNENLTDTMQLSSTSEITPQKHLKIDSLAATSSDVELPRKIQYHSPSKVPRKHLLQTDPSTAPLEESDDASPRSPRKVPRRKLLSKSPETSIQKEFINKMSCSSFLSYTESVGKHSETSSSRLSYARSQTDTLECSSESAPGPQQQSSTGARLRSFLLSVPAVKRFGPSAPSEDSPHTPGFEIQWSKSSSDHARFSNTAVAKSDRPKSGIIRTSGSTSSDCSIQDDSSSGPEHESTFGQYPLERRSEDSEMPTSQNLNIPSEDSSSMPKLEPLPDQHCKLSEHRAQNESRRLQSSLQEETSTSNFGEDSSQAPIQEIPDSSDSFIINVELKMNSCPSRSQEPHRLSIANVWVEPGMSESQTEMGSSHSQQKALSTPPDSLIIRLRYDIDSTQTQSRDNFSISLSRVQLQESLRSVLQDKSGVSTGHWNSQNLPQVELPNNLPQLQIKIDTLQSDHKEHLESDPEGQQKQDPLKSHVRKDLQLQNQNESCESDSNLKLRKNLKSVASQYFERSCVSDSNVKVKIENVQSPVLESSTTDSNDSLQSPDQEQYQTDSTDWLQSTDQEPYTTDSNDSLQSPYQEEICTTDSSVDSKPDSLQSSNIGKQLLTDTSDEKKGDSQQLLLDKEESVLDSNVQVKQEPSDF